MGPCEPSEIQQGQGQCVALGSVQTQVMSTDWKKNSLGAALWRRTWEFCWMKSWTQASRSFAACNTNSILDCIKREVTSRAREVIVSLLCPCEDPPGVQAWGPQYKNDGELL